MHFARAQAASQFADRRNNFVAAVTHELRTPLTSIRMYGEMLRDDMVASEAVRREYYATITSESERLTRLINNVLEHGELRNGRRTAHVEPTDLAALVTDVVDLMKPHIEHEGFSTELDISAEPLRVAVDVDAFKQVLFNIVDNALKYGRAGTHSKLQIRCAADGDSACVVVFDFGPGVSDVQLQSIFEPFFRGEDELTRRQKGTGIGLSLVRDLVELMHARVEAIRKTPGLEIRIVFGPVLP